VIKKKKEKKKYLAETGVLLGSGAEHRVCLRGFHLVISSGLVGSLGGVPREQKMLKGHLTRVIYHQVY